MGFGLPHFIQLHKDPMNEEQEPAAPDVESGHAVDDPYLSVMDEGAEADAIGPASIGIPNVHDNVDSVSDDDVIEVGVPVAEAALPTNTSGRSPLARVLAQLQPSENFEDSAREALDVLQVTAEKAFGPEVKVIPFGSFVQGTHLQGSDLDLCIDAPGLVDGNEAKVDALRRLMTHLPSTILVKEQRFFRHIRVPIIVLQYRSTAGDDVEADVSIGGVDEKTGLPKGCTDRMIRQVLAQVPMALPLVRLVKLWAKVESLNKAFEGFLNSLGWTLLCLYFLVEQGKVTPELFHWSGDNAESLSTLPPPMRQSVPDMPSSSHIADFFDCIVGFEAWLDEPGGHSRGISLIEGTAIQNPHTERSPFYIEDPGARLVVNAADNVARALTEDTWRMIFRRCEEASKRLRARRGPEGGSPAVAWLR